MSENNKEETIIKQENPKTNNEGKFKESDINKKKDKVNELTVEEKLSISEDKLLRSLAEIENDGVPTDDKVADIFDAILPLFPTPQIITFDLHFAIAFTASSKDLSIEFFNFFSAFI